MTIGKQLAGNFPSCINKNGNIFSSLIANNTQTGTFEKFLNDAEKYTKEYVNTPDIYKQTGDQLNITSKFFSYFERYTDETESSFKQRISAIFERSGDLVWGNPYDVKNVFQHYFKNAKIYVVENVGNMADGVYNENLILDHDFQSQDVWELSGCNYDREARFSKSYGVNLVEDGTCVQSVEVDASKIYHLHFYLKGKASIQIKNNENKYWNNTVYYDVENETWISGTWENSPYTITNESEDWNDIEIKIINNENTDELTFTFIGEEDGGFIDYVRLFEYKNYPSFTVIAHYNGTSTTQSAASLAPGNDDVITDPLDAYSYIEKAFLTGVNNGGFSMDLYNDVLDYVRAAGVKGFIEIVNRDE